MNEINLISSNGLIESNIKPRKETYYLVTEEHLKNLTGKSILSDIFFFISSILWGAFFSVTIAKETIKTINIEVLKSILIYQNVFMYFAILFTFIALIFLILAYNSINKIKKSALTKDT